MHYLRNIDLIKRLFKNYGIHNFLIKSNQKKIN